MTGSAAAREVDRLRRVYDGYEAAGRMRVRWSPVHPGNRAMADERARVLGRLLARAGRLPLDAQRILDLGCGDGSVLGMLRRWGASPHRSIGVDLRLDALAVARAAQPGVGLACANGVALPCRSASVDMVLAFTVFTSVLHDDVSRALAAEIGRVLRPGGALVWYDFRVGNPWNRNVRGVSRARLEALFRGWPAHLRRVTLLPPVARRLGAATGVLYPLLAAMPVLRTHWIGLLERP